MKDYSIAIERLLAEHEKTLTRFQDYDKAITKCLMSLKQSWIPGRPVEIEHELDNLQESLLEIKKDLEEHIQIEEKEVLPVLTKYAADIINRGVLYEHEQILEAIVDLHKHARNLVEKNNNREVLLNGESKIKESINQILTLIQEHYNAQEVIYNLAQESMAETNNSS